MLATLAIIASLVCDGVTDNGPLLSHAIDVAKVINEKVIELPAEPDCFFATQPKPLEDGITLMGHGKSNTVLIFGMSDATFIRLRKQGSGLRDLTIAAGPGTYGSIGIGVQCDNGPHGCGNHVIEHVWITSLSGNTWGVPLNIDGNRQVAPIGARSIFLNDVTLFNAQYWAAVFSNCHGCEWFGGGAYQGAGTTGGIFVGNGSTNTRIDANFDKSKSSLSGMRNPQ